MPGRPLREYGGFWALTRFEDVEAAARDSDLGFGRGRHRCVGMSLARLSLRIGLEELLARTRSIELAGEIETTRMPEVGAQGVPLRVTAA